MSVLKVNNVSIRYMTGDFKDIGLKEYVMRKATRNYKVSEFWADRHVSFTLEKGDMLGIIGTNGAGKSTLLKVVSGIMEPSEGSVQRDGSVAALLELASGFDGDLTVRENTYLRGAMLGYTKKFMDDTYDQIIEFAELRDFQDRPFKQLSSGMKSRLAFSIASLVKPDILILDEVLSVGDGAFRKKSEDKMREIIEGGATTILVSHSLGQIRELCNKVLWLHKGEQIAYGENVEEICDQYQAFLEGGQKLEKLPNQVRPGQQSVAQNNSQKVSDEGAETQSAKENAADVRRDRRRRFWDCVKRQLPRTAIVLLLTALIEWFYFGFCNVDFSIPLLYRGDGIGGTITTRSLISGINDLKGWPYFEDVSMYASQTGLIAVIFQIVCGLFTKDPVIVFNLLLYAIPLFNVLVFYYVMRHFKVRDWLAYLSALTFGFCPYVQYRYLGHIALGAIECIPLVIMLCFWCAEDPNFECPGRKWGKYGRNWCALLFSWMIANNGMVYYPYFSCFVFLVVALCLLMRERKMRAMVAPAMLIVQIAGWVALGFVPTIIGIIAGKGNVASQGAYRPIGMAIKYCLRLTSLVLSPKGYGMPILQDVITELNNYTAQTDSFYNENAYAYMGIVGVIGFAILLLGLFMIPKKKRDGSGILSERISLLSKITLGIILLSVSTGFCAIINIFIKEIRCYNRISPFIVCCGVFAVTLLAEEFLRKDRERIVKALFACLVIAVFSYGLWEQQGCYNYLTVGRTEEYRKIYTDDEVFVSKIEDTSGENAMIFQLPYMRSFENGPVGNIPDYDHNRGTFHSDTLRWSYGGMTGSENDVWYRETSRLTPVDMVNELYHQGFAGIWLNLAGYTQEAGDQLKEELCAAAHCDEPICCADGNTIYIPLSQEVQYSIRFDNILSITYLATEDNVQTILSELGGDKASVSYLEGELMSNGQDGESHTISFPEDGPYHVHYKTPEEKGELVAVATVVDKSDFALPVSGDIQIERFPFTIQNETIYKVEIQLAEDTDVSAASVLNIDLYAGASYDRPAQQVAGFYTEGRNTYTFYIDSGDVDGDTIDGMIRVFSYVMSPAIEVKEFMVTEMEIKE